MSRTPWTHARPETAPPQACSTTPARPHRQRVVLGVLVSALAVALCVLTPGTALAITRATVLARAQAWVDKPVPYSQAKYHLGYRTDCSGYVSMC